ncbi:S8 family serine peptidase [Amycolatopsis magusensis]|uniref:Subtilisin family serine protease n=1 Tax=Amycolatopsis magusensis TaxID=882444 RepID=A0ABS4PUV1_9PSEU|nr:S8 family serine peptidase [Amycolatopsis magusensis]MBP2183213.1 subtilisin family serine protease [Amycolatopsis magusensis]MDI5977476.1 S8 family serine peptidase [Amycolatopsis magusensis]
MTDGASGTTGRYLVLLEEDSAVAGARSMADVAGLRTASTADLYDTATAGSLGDADGLLLHELGVAVVTAGEDQVAALTAAADAPGPISRIEPERTVFAISPAAPTAEQAAIDEKLFTWGLQATRAHESQFSGKGVRVAVLDTGVDVGHPDFAGRTLVTSSFVTGEDVQDANGHGTHCIGTSCGPRKVDGGPGYGIAYEAEIYAGKVLGNSGSGSDGGILAGISWAISNGCAIISMSLGADTNPGDPFSPVYEQVAQRALSRGTLIIAAAGNASERANGSIAPIGHPANCPSILAVGAVDSAGAIADFSSGSVDAGHGVDIGGPGVNVHSAWPMPKRYRSISGTSMATPHVSGLAALVAQKYGARGWELWGRLSQCSLRSGLSSQDSGVGLVQAP